MEFVIHLSERDYKKCLHFLREGIYDTTKAPSMCKIVEAILSGEFDDE